MSAQPSPNPVSNEPVMTLSVPPAKTTRASVSAAAAPTTREVRTMRVTGPVFGVPGDTAWFRRVLGWVSVLMWVSLSQSVVGLESRSGGARGWGLPAGA